MGAASAGLLPHTGVVTVCDGTPEAERRIERILWNDPVTGVTRHADSGYESAVECVREKRLDLSSLEPN
jgi:urocanate hydratase